MAVSAKRRAGVPSSVFSTHGSSARRINRAKKNANIAMSNQTQTLIGDNPIQQVIVRPSHQRLLTVVEHVRQLERSLFCAAQIDLTPRVWLLPTIQKKFAVNAYTSPQTASHEAGKSLRHKTSQFGLDSPIQ